MYVINVVELVINASVLFKWIDSGNMNFTVKRVVRKNGDNNLFLVMGDIFLDGDINE